MKNSIFFEISLIFVCIYNTSFSQKYSFENYSTKQGLAQSQAYKITQDNNNFIWIGTLNGVSKFDGKTFKNFDSNNGLKGNKINDIFTDSNKTWIGTDFGLNYIIGDKIYALDIPELANAFIVSIGDFHSHIAIAYNKNNLLLVDKKTFNYQSIKTQTDFTIKDIHAFNNKLYIATDVGLYYFSDNTLTKDTLLPNNKYYGVLNTFNKKLYFTSDRSLYSLDNKNQVTKYISFNKIIRDFIIDKENSIWVTTKDTVYKKSINGELSTFNKANGFDYVSECILEDSEGNIWIGTEGKGIFKLANEAITYLTTKEGLHSDLILSFTEDKNKNMWFSSFGEGIAVKKNNTYFTYNDSKNYIGNNTVWTSLTTSDGLLWFGTSKGLVYFEKGKFHTVNFPGELTKNKVQSLYEDENQTLWVGSKKGLFTIKNRQVSLKVDNVENIRSILKKSNEEYYLASSNGLFIYNLNTNTAIQINDSNLNNNTIYSLTYKNNILWIGSSTGLFKLEKNKTTKVTLSYKNYNLDLINFTFIDSKENLWVGTNYGLFKKNKKSKGFIHYTINTGLIGMETNLGAIYEDFYGNIWIGTSEGVSIIQPSKEREFEIPKLKIQLNEVNLFYDKKNWLTTDNPTFKFNKNNITFRYLSPYFKNPSKVSYSYMLEGFDETWSPKESNDFVRYSNLPHGEYKFLVKSTIDGEEWSNIATYSFSIRAPFWLTWWFRISFLGFVFGIIYWVFRRQKIRQREKRHAEILSYKNKLIKLEQQSLNASMNRHFIFNALNSIQFYINKEDKLSANKYLSSFAKLIRKNLDSSSNEDGLISLKEEIERLELYLSLEKMRFKDKFTYTISIDKSVNSEKTMVPGMFLQPFIENSIWHGILPTNEEGHISLHVSSNKEYILFTIEDNGIGIDVSKSSKKNELTNHNSKGMLITNNRIQLLEKITGKKTNIKGPYQIEESGMVKGTRVEIKFKH